MSKRFNDVDIQVAIAGDEFPKLLSTEFKIIALVCDTCLAITASIHSDNGLFADICSENPFGFELPIHVCVDSVFDRLKPINVVAN